MHARADDTLSKLETPVDLTPDSRPYRYPATFLRQPTTGPERLVVGNTSGGVALFRELVLALAPPYSMLYVLIVPRGTQVQGRYESEPHTAAAFEEFVERYAEYLGLDARFHLWAFSGEDEATIVWDNHDILYLYGPLDRFERVLTALGYVRGPVDVPGPHVHHYRDRFDADAADLLASRPWLHTPLRPGDDD